MNFESKPKNLLIFILAVLLIVACGGSGESATKAPIVEAPETAVPATEAAIIHVLQPADLPAERSSHAGDQDSSASPKAAQGGDFFTRGRFERPYNANSMDVYFGEIDIIDTTFYMDDIWAYASITTTGGVNGTYALEIDSDLDGRGDVLVIASAPASTEWSVTGVQVWTDGDNSVGGLNPVSADPEKASQNGYDDKIFESGNGADADLAWARISSNESNTIHIAVKRSEIASEKFMWGTWAGHDAMNPSVFDLNDSYTIDEAGAAMTDSQYYPIKALSELDNTCRQPIGFEATGNEYGLCPESAPAGEQPAPTKQPKPTKEPPQACQQPASCPDANWQQDVCKCVYPQ